MGKKSRIYGIVFLLPPPFQLFCLFPSTTPSSPSYSWYPSLTVSYTPSSPAPCPHSTVLSVAYIPLPLSLLLTFLSYPAPFPPHLTPFRTCVPSHHPATCPPHLPVHTTSLSSSSSTNPHLPPLAFILLSYPLHCILTLLPQLLSTRLQLHLQISPASPTPLHLSLPPFITSDLHTTSLLSTNTNTTTTPLYSCPPPSSYQPWSPCLVCELSQMGVHKASSYIFIFCFLPRLFLLLDHKDMDGALPWEKFLTVTSVYVRVEKETRTGNILMGG